MSGGAFVSACRDGPLLIVTIERLEAMNALRPPAHREMAAAFDDFAADRGSWIAIVTGAGAWLLRRQLP